MAGMMPKGMAPKLGVETPEGVTNPDVEEGSALNVEGEPASEEEQARYDEFVKEGYRLMYEGGEAKEGVLKLLDEDPSDLIEVLGNAEELQQFTPVVALAAATAVITLEVAKETGETDGVILLHAGKALLEELVELSEASKRREYSEEEMGAAMRMAADLFREAAVEEGLIDLEEAKEEWGELVAADKEGRLGEMLPEIANAQVAEQAPAEEEVPADGQS